MAQHLLVVVGFEDEMCTFQDVLLDILRHITHIGHHGEAVIPHLDIVTDILGCIMGQGKCCDSETSNLERFFLINVLAILYRNLHGVLPVLVHAFVNERSGIHWDVVLFAEFAGSFDVVGVVVGDDHAFHFTNFHPIFLHIFLETTNTDATINDDGVRFCCQIIAIAATAAAKAKKC